jgi:MFS family permease
MSGHADDHHADPSSSARSAVRRLAVGRVISLTGTFAASIALSYSIYERTGSTAWVAATMLLTFGVVGFFGPIAGAIGDRFDRRRVMIVGEAGAAACWGLMAVTTDAPRALLALAFCASTLEAPFSPTATASIPNLAGEDNLAWANSLISAGGYVGLTLGPLVGGLLVASIGPRWVFAANALSFLVSVALVASVRGDFTDPARSPGTIEDHQGLSAGFWFIAGDRVLRWMLLSWLIFVLGTASTIVAEPVLAKESGTGSLGYGLLTSCWGSGTIVGAWLSRRVREDREARWIVGFGGLMALTCLGVAVSPWFWLILVWVAGFGLADGPTQVVEQNLLQRRTPDVVRARVMGAWDAIMQGAVVLALLIGAAIVPIVGPRGTFAFAGLTGLIGAAMLSRLLRWLPAPGSVAEPVFAGAENG